MKFILVILLQNQVTVQVPETIKMKIAVIGAGISGLTAGRQLADAGHYVVVFEEDVSYGGKLATYNSQKNGGLNAEIGVPYLEAETEEFKSFIKQLSEKGLVKQWEGVEAVYNGSGQIQVNEASGKRYYAVSGMSGIGKYIGLPLEIRFNETVGGLTHIGEDRIKKRTWMLNFPTSATENFDAVIIAVPSRRAYGILNLTADEREALRLISIIDEVVYSPQYTLLLVFENHTTQPDWSVLNVEDNQIINRIINQPQENNSVLVVHSTAKFAMQNIEKDKDEVADRMNDAVAEILGEPYSMPTRRHLHFWKYAKAENPLPFDYLEFENNKSPLALVGGYFNGSSLEKAYLSGLKLGNHWVSKFAQQV